MHALADYEASTACASALAEREQLLRRAPARPVAAHRLPQAWRAMAHRIAVIEEEACCTHAA
jgi:hypothetical protein